MHIRKWVAHTHYNLDKKALLERKAKVIHIPDMRDNPHWLYNRAVVEGNFQKVHNLVLAVDNFALEVDNRVVGIQGRVDMVGMQAEKEVLQRDVMLESQRRVHDTAFADQCVFLEQHRWQGFEVSQ